jgi:GNAT superfamily N-acetyltransferase
VQIREEVAVSEYSIRVATVNDAALIAYHRRAMFTDMGYTDTTHLESMETEFADWVREKLARGEYLGWFVVNGEAVIAGAGLWLMDWPPHIIGTGARRGNILNVYTHPDYRRRGLARHLMTTILDWCRANSLETVILHASAEGRALYESLGFKATNEMRISTDG